MTRTRHPVLAAALWGGFIAGTLDIGAASVISGYNPLVILKYIAGGVLGKSALAGGPSVAILGLLLQWGMSFIIAAIFVLATRRHAGVRLDRGRGRQDIPDLQELGRQPLAFAPIASRAC